MLLGWVQGIGPGQTTDTRHPLLSGPADQPPLWLPVHADPAKPQPGLSFSPRHPLLLPISSTLPTQPPHLLPAPPQWAHPTGACWDTLVGRLCPHPDPSWSPTAGKGLRTDRLWGPKGCVAHSRSDTDGASGHPQIKQWVSLPLSCACHSLPHTSSLSPWTASSLGRLSQASFMLWHGTARAGGSFAHAYPWTATGLLSRAPAQQ